jgi:hypothetical protein
VHEQALVCGGTSRGTQVLTFYTWWNENGKRQTMTMHLNPETKVWRVKVRSTPPCAAWVMQRRPIWPADQNPSHVFA